MELKEVFDRIESPDFSADVNVASGLAAFYPYPLSELSTLRAGALALLFIFITFIFLRAAKSARVASPPP